MNRLIATIKHLIKISTDDEVIKSGLFKPLHLKSDEYFLKAGQCHIVNSSHGCPYNWSFCNGRL